MPDNHRWQTGLIATLVALLVLASSAAPAAANETATLEYEVVVTEDGTVETIDIVMTNDQETHELFEWFASDEGYESVADWYGSGLVEQEPMFDNYTGENREVDGGYESHVTITEVNHSASENMSVTTDDGTMRWELHNGETMGEGEYDEITFTVRMPGDVTDSNADEVSGESAVWNLAESTPENLYVESAVGDESGIDDTDDEVDDTSNSDDGDDDTSDSDDGDDDTSDSDDGMPGLGVVGALAGLLGAAALAVRRSD